jgi:NADH-quinone oxidoreductase subunit M
MIAPLSAPWETLTVCLLLLLAPAAASPRHARAWHLAGVALAIVVGLFATNGTTAYVATAAGLLLHAWRALPLSRTGALFVAGAGLVTVGAALAIGRGELTLAFALSSLAIALAAGVLPLHVGAASLCDRLPLLQAGNLSSTIALVFIHLRFVDHHSGAIELAPFIVRYGAAACVAAALLTLVQTDLRGFYRGTMSMHAGMLLAAVGSASLGNYAAALLVAIAMGLALGGLGIVIASLEERAGPVVFSGPGGRAGAFPRLTVAFALFGGAGVAIPGTAGFVADDLLLHTLWMVSPASTVIVILSSALLAVATLGCMASVFFGRMTSSLAPDLHPRERIVVVALVTLLVVLGLAPGLLLGPADAFLTPAPAQARLDASR